MEVYIKESLLVLDYKDNIVDAIFLSNDNITPGYAYDINITEANTGYSDLKFNMPNYIIDDNGDKVENPRLKLLTPLVKLRYHREVYYTGEKDITVREPQGYGDETAYIDKTYTNKYPNNIVEDYIMDYIVQPVDKKRDVLKLTTSFNAIDYPRFNLSKKRVGLTISQDTLTKKEWTLFQNKPMDVPGTIKYEQWTNDLTKNAGGDINEVPLEWYPDKANEYPLDETMITTLMNNKESWPYGLLGTAFYWPIKSTGRFEGQMYKKGGFLVLQLYDFYSLTTEGIDPDKHIGRYSWDWTYLEEVDSYLTPNNACNYLYHILDGTNWKVKLKEDGTPDVDIVKVDIPNPTGSTESTTKADHTCNISVSGSNCYNAITSVCKGLQLYPIFDCINREVSLKVFAGKNYGLTYSVGSNLTSTGVKHDGEKVITKLYVSGGKDYKGDENINIGEAERSYIEPTDNPDTREPWNPNDPEYIIKRSPYGTNYIMNFKWIYDNQWITKEEILDLYRINQQINDLNKEFMIPYTEDRLKTLQMYNDAVNNYDLKQGEYQSILNSMMNKYYKVYGQYSQGTFYAFHKSPMGTHQVDGKNYIWIGHCKDCKKTWSSVDRPSVCECGSTNIQVDELYIPVYADFPNVIPPTNPDYPYGIDTSVSGPEYAPYLKGDYLKLLTTLDDENHNWTITDYESKISIIEPIQYMNGQTVDGREYQIDGVWVKASSENIREWNEDIRDFVKNYGEMLDALDTVNYCLEKIKELQEQYDDWKEKYDTLQAEIQDKYGDYIIEGNYKNDEQPYVGLLFNEGMEASNKYAVPEITYSLDVIDSTGLIEYRQPTITLYECGECGGTSTHSNYGKCPYCNSEDLITIRDTYNELVHILHSVGQIVPKAGDYISIYDEEAGLKNVPGLITEISRTLDKPINNKIKIDTSYTDNEELVGNIINATNTVLGNADIYARTAVLKADGTIDSEAISSSIDNPNASISIVGTNGNMLLTGSSLRFTDPDDSTKAIKYSGTGIFTTTTLNESGAATEWQKLITPTGINATYINAGQIDTKSVSIMSGMTSKILLDQYGLVIKNEANKSAHITTFDKDAATNDANYARSWGTTNNIAGFMGVDTNKEPLLYTRGLLVAEEGSNIANWITSNKGFFHLNSNNVKDLWLSPNGISGTINENTDSMAIYAGGNFGVSTNGRLYAKSGNISGWNIDAVQLQKQIGDYSFEIRSDRSAWEPALLVYKSYGDDQGYKFYVRPDGFLYAKNADISGTINASSGNIGGWTIKDDYLGNISDVQNESSASENYFLSQNGKYAYCSMNKGQHNYYLFFKDKFAVETDGTLYVKGAVITGGSTFSGKLSAATGSFKGSLDAATGTFSGDISAATGTFTGGIKTNEVTLGNWYLSEKDLACIGGYGGIIFTGDYLKYSGPLGNKNALWHDIAANNSSDRRLKEKIQTLDNTVEDFFDSLQPVSYHFKPAYDLHPEKVRFGFIAQDVLESSKNCLKEEIGAISINSGDNMYDLNKQDFIALNTWQIQKLKKEVKELKQELQELKKEKTN